jgi:hypothetical protein
VRVTEPAGEAGEEARAPLGGQAAELELGISVGREPQASFTEDTVSGVVITRSSSWWNKQRCKTCGHTFRRGDRALVDAATRSVQHLMPGLDCGTDPDATAADGAGGDREAFADGLLATWPATVPVSRLERTDRRIPRPGDQQPAPTCLYCGHTFRPGEHVVICPCQPEKQVCGIAVHRDPASGSPCWDRWQPTGKLTVCPTTTARL